MTNSKPIEPQTEEHKQSFDELLTEVIVLRNDKFAFRKMLEAAQKDNERLKKLLDEALTELSRWKVECLDRRKLMVQAQRDQTIRVPILGGIGK